MNLLFPAFSALWIGILASVSPCPLASNIAAFSFIEKDCGNNRSVLLSGVAYALGRMVTFSVLGFLVVNGVMAIPSVSMALQRHMNMFLGPILLVVGVFVLDLLELPPFSFTKRIRDNALFKGPGGAFVMGIIFALALCPVSAALFFGGLVPLAAKESSPFLLPAIFGIGTALPVTVLAFSLSLGISALSASEASLHAIQEKIRILTGVILVGTGIYFSVFYTFKIF
ncbi:MAG TPA: cytochrome C biogenesis protein [Synergistaceae bacterium]|jgi:cytochrome c biogenesis protein CcdA|nr:MAG: Cytochrome c biogenesis protein transmembrane region [Synergistales bacterium 53_16]KUL01981.1 MAG: Cytochrome c biogenesis protein transmembrane region [Synergistales bacterium 54_9]HAA47013.1 cytochrome C biogenesis protein [Synergistaceae bacterium]HAG22857.1 cytochrome C biogenesis protein [Synergistaceae bacterium]